MTPEHRSDVPLITRATSPSFPNRVAVLLSANQEVVATYVFGSTTARDAWIRRMIGLGAAARPAHGCGSGRCNCEFPTLLLDEDDRGALVPWAPSEADSGHLS